MKILILNTLYYPYKVGGAEVSVQLLAEGLVSEGHQVRVVALHPEKRRLIKNINGVDVVYLPLKNVYWPFSKDKKSLLKKIFWHILDTLNPFMMKLVDQELIDFKPDLVHTNNICGFSVLAWKKVKDRNIRLIHTARDYYLFHPNSTLFSNGKNMDEKSLSVRFWSLIKKRYSSYVDCFVGISDFVVSIHKENGFFKNIPSECVYNPVSTPNVPDKKIDLSHLIVGFIGRLSEEKGFYDYCQMAKKYTSNNLSFVAAGAPNSGVDDEDIKKYAIKNNVALLGFIPVEEFLSKVDVVIFPIKWREPFGRSVVECVLAEKIVFSNFLGGLNELAKLIHLYNLDDIDLFFEEPEKYLMMKGEDIVSIDDFSNEKCIKLINHIYN